MPDIYKNAEEMLDRIFNLEHALYAVSKDSGSCNCLSDYCYHDHAHALVNEKQNTAIIYIFPDKK